MKLETEETSVGIFNFRVRDLVKKFGCVSNY